MNFLIEFLTCLQFSIVALMFNIFNLFLFLFALWILFMISAGNISWLYVFFGVIASALVSFFSYKAKLINDDSELLYLSFGFYKHFIKTYFANFFSSINLIIDLTFNSKLVKPALYTVDFSYKEKFNPALLMTTFNMTTGLFCIGVKEDQLTIHAISEKYFKRFDLLKNLIAVSKANDDKLV